MGSDARATSVEGWNYRESVTHYENRVWIVFMPNLVDRLTAAISHIEPVRTIYHHAVNIADILISVDDTFGDQHRFRIVRANNQRHHIPKRCRGRAIVPHSQFEI